MTQEQLQFCRNFEAAFPKLAAMARQLGEGPPRPLPTVVQPTGAGPKAATYAAPAGRLRQYGAAAMDRAFEYSKLFPGDGWPAAAAYGKSPSATPQEFRAGLQPAPAKPAAPPAPPAPGPAEPPKHHDEAMQYMLAHPGMQYQAAVEHVAQYGADPEPPEAARQGHYEEITAHLLAHPGMSWPEACRGWWKNFGGGKGS